MGRGRAKAKQTKVARQLKYGGPSTDLGRLQAELSGHADDEVPSTTEQEVAVVPDPFEDDPYADRYAVDPYAESTDDEADEDEAGSVAP